MLRSALLWASNNPALAERLPRMAFVRRASRKFMPGEELKDALEAARRLEERGAGVLVTELGENVTTTAEARAVVDHYRELLESVRSAGLDIEASVKLTQLGLDLGVDEATRNLEAICREADGALVWVDMEGSAYVDGTLEVYRTVLEAGLPVGLCLQSYLRRTSDDLDALLPLEPAIRLVKGAYREPPEIAFPKKREVDAAFKKLTTKLMREAHLGRMGRVGIGTHDPAMIGHAKTIAHELGMRDEAWEVEMLYGIAPAQQAALLRSSTRLRVLISYGSAWFPWYMRRLAERPANVWFVAKQIVSR